MILTRAKLCLILLITLALSLSLKVASVDVALSAGDIRAKYIDAFLRNANDKGFTRKTIRDLTVDGTYKLHVLYHADCPTAAMGLVPMFRNAESTHLIDFESQNASLDVAYYYNGSQYSAFPETQFWMGRYTHRLRGLLNMPDAPLMTGVTQVMTHGPCEHFAAIYG